MALRFQDTVWLLQESKTAFFSPRYSQESLSVCTQVFPFWTQPQIVLRLGPVEYLVLHSSPADAAKRSEDPNETKKLLQVTVRPLVDVRRTQLYQTAASTQVLEFFVDVEPTRARLLRCLRGEEGQEREQTGEQGKKLLDDAFVALEQAQKCSDKDTALRLYQAAEKGFGEAEKLLQDDRSRALVRTRRGDLQRTIRGFTEVAVELSTHISERLEELRQFAAEQENVTESDNRTDLVGRLAALKNERAGPAPPIDDLAKRLRRLKGDGGSIGTAAVESDVYQMIEQMADEITLGIEDEETKESENLDSDIASKSERSSSFKSS
ncbi:hypothetical protein PHMEG_00013360 [Phytophthora megakarya]|uniref:Uncharacterized protein n=1 Tax=Phytophthora megakarya TaxID=4795 RepID=A0A225W7F8_9STRA|nr:hypothetical protein PHMEG_00013360 [Phytophthora megakarya]